MGVAGGGSLPSQGTCHGGKGWGQRGICATRAAHSTWRYVEKEERYRYFQYWAGSSTAKNHGLLLLVLPLPRRASPLPCLWAEPPGSAGLQVEQAELVANSMRGTMPPPPLLPTPL